MPVLTARARLQKLRAMTLGEVAERLRYRAVLAVERAAHARGRLSRPADLERALVAALRGRSWQARLLAARQESTGRFFAGPCDGDATRELFHARYVRERTQAMEHAASALQHRFEFFGRTFSYGPDIDWQADPVSGRRWPAVFHADVPVHGGDVGYGDVKYVWELNRQQYLVDLAKSAFLEDRADSFDGMRRLVRSWIAGNPYGTGVNWACALEPAFRAWSWLWAYHLTIERLDPAFHLEWLGAFHDHGRFLARHLERYSSPYNHLIGEAAALYALGCLFPEFQASRRWRRVGKSVLQRRLRQQFYADGGSAEQSTFYHHATTGFYLLAGLLARANDDDLGKDVQAAVERALDFSAALVQPDGRIPEIGGADDGKPIRLEHLPYWDFRPYLAIGAVVFGRPDFKALAGRFHEDALWLLGPGGLAKFDVMDARSPRQTSVLLSASGYAVDRSGWTADADYVCFDVGEQAAGLRADGVPNSMHGHADCLSVLLWLGGRRVLVDSGLYAYNCGGPWEAHFRRTAAHNTARIDGRDQARHIGKMAWSHSYRAQIDGRSTDDRQAWTLASHDGFARGPEGVVHRRAVWRRPGGYVVICDEFTGAGRHEIEVNWQFAPGRLSLRGPGRVSFKDDVEAAWVGNVDWVAEVRCGGDDPADGWICRSLGVREPAPRLTLRGVMTASPVALLTVIADSRRADAGPWTRAHGVAGIEIRRAGGVDVVVAPVAARNTAIDTDAMVVICQLDEDGRVGHERLGGTFCRIDTGELVTPEGVPQWVS